MPDRLVKWLVFSVAIALVPIGVAALVAFVQGRSGAYHDFIGNGELLLLAVGICATAIGELIEDDGPSETGRALPLAVGGFIAILMITASLLFATLTYGPEAEPARVAWTSLVVYSSALVAGTVAILIREA